MTDNDTPIRPDRATYPQGEGDEGRMDMSRDYDAGEGPDEIHAGKIFTVIRIQCAHCDASDDVTRETERTARFHFAGLGWLHEQNVCDARKREWLCPDCVKRRGGENDAKDAD